MKTSSMILLMAMASSSLPAAVYQTIKFNSSLSELLKDSFGNDLSSSYTAALGTFDGTFVPTDTNYNDWGTSWRMFATTPVTIVPEDNPEVPQIQMEADILDTGRSSFSGSADIDFRGKEVWLWVYNGANLETSGTEWFLGRASSYSVSGVSWNFPTFTTVGCCPSVDPLDLALVQFSTETPVWGSQGEEEGGGFASVNSPTHTLQTHMIPEPGTWVMMGIFGATALSILGIRRKGERS